MKRLYEHEFSLKANPHCDIQSLTCMTYVSHLPLPCFFCNFLKPAFNEATHSMQCPFLSLSPLLTKYFRHFVRGQLMAFEAVSKSVAQSPFAWFIATLLCDGSPRGIWNKYQSIRLLEAIRILINYANEGWAALGMSGSFYSLFHNLCHCYCIWAIYEIRDAQNEWWRKGKQNSCWFFGISRGSADVGNLREATRASVVWTRTGSLPWLRERMFSVQNPNPRLLKRNPDEVFFSN